MGAALFTSYQASQLRVSLKLNKITIIRQTHALAAFNLPEADLTRLIAL